MWSKRDTAGQCSERPAFLFQRIQLDQIRQHQLVGGVFSSLSGFAKEELRRKTRLESRVIAKYLFW
jgi:hypothetical protein